MTAAATTATTMATTITGRLESLRQMSYNPRLCSGVTIHERSNRGRRLRQRRDNGGNDDEDKQLINHHHFIKGKYDVRRASIINALIVARDIKAK